MCSASNQPAPMPSSTRPPLIWSTCATEIASGPGSRKVAAVIRVPSRIRLVSRASPAEGDPGVGGPGQAVAAHRQVVVGPEEGVEAGLLGAPGDGQQVVVGGAHLGLGEDPQLHAPTLTSAAARRRPAGRLGVCSPPGPGRMIARRSTRRCSSCSARRRVVRSSAPSSRRASPTSGWRPPRPAASRPSNSVPGSRPPVRPPARRSTPPRRRPQKAVAPKVAAAVAAAAPAVASAREHDRPPRRGRTGRPRRPASRRPARRSAPHRGRPRGRGPAGRVGRERGPGRRGYGPPPTSARGWRRRRRRHRRPSRATSSPGWRPPRRPPSPTPPPGSRRRARPSRRP